MLKTVQCFVLSLIVMLPTLASAQSANSRPAKCSATGGEYSVGMLLPLAPFTEKMTLIKGPQGGEPAGSSYLTLWLKCTDGGQWEVCKIDGNGNCNKLNQ